MARLKVWNGRPYGILPVCLWKLDGYVAHVSACATGLPDLQRLCGELGLPAITRGELSVYWSNCWGNCMAGIAPERGLWVTYRPLTAPIQITREWLARVTARGGEGNGNG